MTRPTLFASSLVSIVLALSLVGCDAADDKDLNESVADSASRDTYELPVDGDGDGVTVADGDCDDADATIYPGQVEDCDGVDDNCNGVVDEGLGDSDNDGTADCMDLEECDGVDNDGDGEIDEGYADSDGNGVADCVGVEECDGVDNNGDGRVDEGFDADGDGATQCGSETAAADCDDTNADVSPTASETAGDLVDNDCDGLVDEGEWAAGDLAISELMINPALVSDPNGEYIELYNTTDRTLILNGVLLTSSVDGEEHMISSDELITVAPGEFFVLGGNDDSSANGGYDADYVYDGVSLLNETDELVIIADGVIIDAVSWDDGVTMPDPDGASIGTDFGNYDASLNDDPTIWCVSTLRWRDDPTADKGSPGEDNEYCSTYDHDGDGYTVDQGDCNDGDATVYPGAWEGTNLIDNDCDGVAETAPVAVASSTGTGLTCDDIALSSAGSYDIEGAALTYSWELTSAPGTSARSTSDIDTSTSANPSFSPDVAGTYTFTLVVNDGGADSASVSTSVTVTDRGTNSDPVAAAGSNQSASLTSTCSAVAYSTTYTCDDCDSQDFTLSASGSTDADGDVMSYAWAITSGSTYGTLSAATGETVTVTVSGVSATYGSTHSEAVYVELTATDCMGASSTDEVIVGTYCTGA